MSEETIRALSVGGLSYSYRRLRQPQRTTEPVLVLGARCRGCSAGRRWRITWGRWRMW